MCVDDSKTSIIKRFTLPCLVVVSGYYRRGIVLGQLVMGRNFAVVKD